MVSPASPELMWFQENPFPSRSPIPCHHAELLLRDHCLSPRLSRVPGSTAETQLAVLCMSCPLPQNLSPGHAVRWVTQLPVRQKSQTGEHDTSCCVKCPCRPRDIRSSALLLFSTTVSGILNEAAQLHQFKSSNLTQSC